MDVVVAQSVWIYLIPLSFALQNSYDGKKQPQQKKGK